MGEATEAKFYLTDATTSEKLLKSARLEQVRYAVLSQLLLMGSSEYEGQSFMGSGMMGGSGRGGKSGMRTVVPTTITVQESDNGSCSVLEVVTTDRPGLLVNIVRVLKEINMNVVSAEIDTKEGMAYDKFFVTYHGEPLDANMTTLTTNALQYYLSLTEVATEESY